MGNRRREREALDSPVVAERTAIHCAIYTRKSTGEGLDQAFNTLDAQREAAEAYIASQRYEGWTAIPQRYDDGGFTGANMDRPALKRLLDDVEAGLAQCVVVYKVDRLTRSLLDFARIMETLDKRGVTFLSVTQQFNTTTSLGRLTLNILLSFAQFEREMIAERTRDKMRAARRKGKWVGGNPMLGYDLLPQGGGLVLNDEEAQCVRAIYALYLEYGSLMPVIQELDRRGWCMKAWTTRKGKLAGGQPFAKNRLYNLLTSILYTGRIEHQGKIYPGEQPQIVDTDVWNQVQEKLNTNGRTGGRLVRNKYAAILRNILRCASCDAGMVHTCARKGNRLYRYYVCVNAHQRGWNRCETRSVSAPEIEQAVVDQIRGIGRSPALLEEVLRQVEEQRRSHESALESDRRLVERDLKRLTDEMLGLAKISTVKAPAARAVTDRLAEVHVRVSELEQRLADIRHHVQEMNDQVASAADVEEALRGFNGLWQQMPPKEQERFIKMLVNEVRHDGRTGTVTLAFRSAGIRQLCIRSGNEEHCHADPGNRHLEMQFRLRPLFSAPEPPRRRTPAAVESGTLPRITQALALAIQFEGMVRTGEAKDYADLARLGCVTRERISQITKLRCLAPDIQKMLLMLAARIEAIRETDIRGVVALAHWRDQPGACQLWRNAIPRKAE